MKRKKKVAAVERILGTLWIGQQPSKAELHYMATLVVDELKKAKNER